LIVLYVHSNLDGVLLAAAARYTRHGYDASLDRLTAGAGGCDHAPRLDNGMADDLLTGAGHGPNLHLALAATSCHALHNLLKLLHRDGGGEALALLALCYELGLQLPAAHLLKNLLGQARYTRRPRLAQELQLSQLLQLLLLVLDSLLLLSGASTHGRDRLQLASLEIDPSESGQGKGELLLLFGPSSCCHHGSDGLEKSPRAGRLPGICHLLKEVIL
jgi:hypothetical protein